MPRGKKELAEQIIPYAASVEVEVGRGKTVANGGQEDQCDGADVMPRTVAISGSRKGLSK